MENSSIKNKFNKTYKVSVDLEDVIALEIKDKNKLNSATTGKQKRRKRERAVSK